MTKEEGELCCYPGAENLSETRHTHGSEVSAGGSFVSRGNRGEGAEGTGAPQEGV